MISVKANEGEQYDAPLHTGVFGLKKLTDEVTERTTVLHSVFLPNGGAALSSAPIERFYYVISGCMKVTGDGKEHILESGDLIYIAPGEEREITVLGSKPVESLVTVVKP